MSGFDRLHPAVQHHVVNSLGWRSLRPLQDAAIDPVLDGEHALLLAPTAGGKTEAAIFPVLSRMLTEDWRGTSVLYVCPIKALLNNLEPRLSRYTGYVGRRVACWHGDTTDGDRKRILAEPPDILLTTPESIEVMLIFRRDAHEALFGGVRVLVVDEMHAFAGDDRGWHLLAVLERVTRIARREIQRLGLSATIGNPQALLNWLAGSCDGPRRLVAPAAEGPVAPEVTLDHVGTLTNAATVISRLHRGEKRLVFCDSRARVERLATELRGLGVQTHVSHSSLSLDERRRAETAFSEAQDCVIVATSTLELGVDVGDLDRVIQIDAPGTVASFLQRLGRTGRRAGTRRNCLFLTTTDDAFMQASGLLQLWSEGYVEPVEPPPEPFTVFAQQILALVLQESRVGRATWREWIGPVPAFAAMSAADVEAILAHMVATAIVVEDEGMLSIGPEGERQFGRKNFMEVLSVFTSPPLFAVLHGRDELGHVHDSTFVARGDGPVVLSLAGRSWTVKHVDWSRRVAHVEPSQDRGRSRWLGDSRPLGFELCRAMRRVLVQDTFPVTLTRRATETLAELRAEFSWLDEKSTVVVREQDGDVRWWTFAGVKANRILALALVGTAQPKRRGENPSLLLENADTAFDPRPTVARLLAEDAGALTGAVEEAVLDDLKFSACLPKRLAERVALRAAIDARAAHVVAAEPLRQVADDVV